MRSAARTLARERLRVIAIIAVAFLPFVLIETAIIGQQAQAGRESIAAGRVALVRSAAGAADSFVAGNLATLHALTQTRSIRGADADTVNAILRPIVQGDPNWLTIGLSAADGWNLSSLTTAAHSVNIADRDYFQAAAAGKDGVGSVLGPVTVELGRDGPNAVIRVRDEGLGVPATERDQIFDRFFRTSVAKPYGGVGLGLYISKEIVERLGGDIVLESSGAKGSVFRVRLPLQPASVAASR